MKKRTVMILMCMAVGIGALSGCASTPESSLVKQKGAGSMKNYEEGSSLEEQAKSSAKEAADEAADEVVDMEVSEEKEQSGESENKLRLALNAPETYKSEAADETGKLKIITDAVVEIPKADKVSAINISQHPFEQSVMDNITETFFSDGKIYSADSWYAPTKAELLKDLEELKGYVAEGNLDPHNMGTDKNGNLNFDIYKMIEWTEQSYEEAPEERILEEVKPQLDDTGNFSGVAVMDEDTVYRYNAYNSGSYPMHVAIEKHYGADAPMNGSWQDYDTLSYYNKGEAPTPEEVKENIGISLEQAKETAEEKIEKLGLTSMELAEWEYGILWDSGDLYNDGGGYSGEKQLGYGYILHYTRKLNQIPITYTMDQGGAYEEMDSTMEAWNYEELDFYISKDGIDRVDFNNQYDIGDVKTENLTLKPFDEIMEIYEKMMVVTNADVLNYENYRTYKIDRITFGYTRIYEPARDGRSGILVPAWDFFGSFETEYEWEGETGHAENVAKNQSYLTVNAVDGSIINRSLGY